DYLDYGRDDVRTPPRCDLIVDLQGLRDVGVGVDPLGPRCGFRGGLDHALDRGEAGCRTPDRLQVVQHRLPEIVDAGSDGASTRPPHCHHAAGETHRFEASPDLRHVVDAFVGEVDRLLCGEGDILRGAGEGKKARYQ